MPLIVGAHRVGGLSFHFRPAMHDTVVLCPIVLFTAFAGFSGLSKIDNRRHGVYPLLAHVEQMQDYVSAKAKAPKSDPEYGAAMETGQQKYCPPRFVNDGSARSGSGTGTGAAGEGTRINLQ